MPISGTLQKALEHSRNVFTWNVESVVPADSPDKPDYVADWYQEQIDDVALVRTVYGGTNAMRDAKQELLPQHPAEGDPQYDRRLKKAVLYNAFKRTVGGLTGMVFRKDPVLLEDVPDAIAEHAENLDLQGRHLATFGRDLFTANMIDGHSYIHVEFPTVDSSTTRTRAAERQAGVRPYWTHITKSDAINARWEVVNGEPVLDLFVYRESATMPVGLYGQTTVDRYRVLKPGSFEVWEKDEDKSEFRLVDQGNTSLSYIPIVPSYASREAIFRSCPPLLDLVHENVSHWQIRSDLRYALELSCFPIMFMSGVKEDEAMKLGPNWGIRTQEPTADAKWLEPAGTSLEQVRQELKEIEARMASLGLQMLVRETRSAETAQAKLIDKAESDSALSATARSLSDSMENALKIHADYMGLGRDAGGSVYVNDDFRDQEMSAQMLDTLSNMMLRGQLSLETLWERMIEGEILPEDFDTEEERERIDVEPMEGIERFLPPTQPPTRNGSPSEGEEMEPLE